MNLELKDLLPLLTLVVAGGGAWLQQLLHSRDDRYRGKLARDETLEMIELLEKWMKIQEMACSPEEFQQVRKAARQRLDDMYLTLDKVQKSQMKHTTEPPRSLVERIFLVNHPGGVSGWMARVIFYVLIIFAGFFAIGILSAEERPLGIGSAIAFYVTLGILLLPVHAWAVHADARSNQQKLAGSLQNAS
jgi:hypothetical protein